MRRAAETLLIIRFLSSRAIEITIAAVPLVLSSHVMVRLVVAIRKILTSSLRTVLALTLHLALHLVLHLTLHLPPLPLLVEHWCIMPRMLILFVLSLLHSLLLHSLIYASLHPLFHQERVDEVIATLPAAVHGGIVK